MQPRQRSKCSTTVRLSATAPSSLASISWIRPRGESISSLQRTYVGQVGRQKPQCTHSRVSSRIIGRACPRRETSALAASQRGRPGLRRRSRRAFAVAVAAARATRSAPCNRLLLGLPPAGRPEVPSSRNRLLLGVLPAGRPEVSSSCNRLLLGLPSAGWRGRPGARRRSSPRPGGGRGLWGEGAAPCVGGPGGGGGLRGGGRCRRG